MVKKKGGTAKRNLGKKIKTTKKVSVSAHKRTAKVLTAYGKKLRSKNK
jgi:hypothetical protein